MIYNLKISEELYNIIKDYIYEMEYDHQGKDINDFIIEAIVEKFNKDNTIFSGEVDANGWTNGKTTTENYLNI